MQAEEDGMFNKIVANFPKLGKLLCNRKPAVVFFLTSPLRIDTACFSVARAKTECDFILINLM